jgi:hypothetical protein
VRDSSSSQHPTIRTSLQGMARFKTVERDLSGGIKSS